MPSHLQIAIPKLQTRQETNPVQKGDDSTTPSFKVLTSPLLGSG
jgi:hypothetical protein